MALGSALGLSSLTFVGRVLQISANDKLPTCLATALEDQLVLNGGCPVSSLIAFNDDTATCP